MQQQEPEEDEAVIIAWTKRSSGG